MSIWCNQTDIGWEDVDGWTMEDGSPVPATMHGGEVRSYVNGWSNHYPTTDGAVEQRASLGISTIPAWCAGGRLDDFESLGSWLRVDLATVVHDYHEPKNISATTKQHASVVMNEQAVEELHRQLTEWLDRPKVAPSPAAA